MDLKLYSNEKLIMLGGISGSGKSTLANQFKNMGFSIINVDEIRLDLALKQYNIEEFNDYNLSFILEEFSTDAFKIAFDRIKINVLKKIPTVFDATNLTIKRRKQVLYLINGLVKPICIYIECPLDIAIYQNSIRSSQIFEKNGIKFFGRNVNDLIIKRQYLNQILPVKEEGFKEVIIIHKDLNKINKTINIQELKNIDNLEQYILDKNIFKSLIDCYGFEQENINHNLQLHHHMLKTAYYLKEESDELFIAGLLHDIGKIYTKQRFGNIIKDTLVFKKDDKVEIIEVKNKKGFVIAKKVDYNCNEKSELLTINDINIKDNFNYYQHHTYSALLARRELKSYNIDDDFANRVYKLIAHHMDIPFELVSKKTIKKINDNLYKYIDDLLKLRKADKLSSNSDSYINDIYPELVKLFNEIRRNKI